MTGQANSVIAPRVRAVENMVARSVDKSGGRSATPSCPTCRISGWYGAFFDGTDNHKDRDFPVRHSNVVALFHAHKVDEGAGVDANYYEGCGTDFSFSERHQRIARVVGRDRKVVWQDRTGYKEDESLINQAFGRQIDIRLEKAVFDFQTYVDQLRGVSRIDEINVSAFGFSRGATTARAFVHWLRAHSKVTEAAGQLRYDGVPLRFRFLGLFDTVESIGKAGGNDQAALIPTSVPAWVEKCVHTVAAHEVRDAYPVTVLPGSKSNARRVEVVSPGAHSDVGGGYADGVQGRGRGLARINLLQMLDHARGAGLPMLSVEEMRQADGLRWEKQFACSFQLPEGAQTTFDGYMRHVEPASSSLHDTMHAHMKWYWKWIDSGLAAEDTGQKFRRYWQQEPSAPGSAKRRKELGAMSSVLADNARTPAGRGMGAIGGAPKIAPQRGAVPPEVERLFEEYVHDSQVGFRLVGDLMLDLSRIDYYAIRETRAPA